MSAEQPSPHRPSVAIVGGGLAGLAAGSALADAGYQVELFERRPYLGGRASSYELPGTAEVVDNCQHVLLGCCTNLIEFYRRLGVEQQIRWYDEITFILPGGHSSTLKPGALPPRRRRQTRAREPSYARDPRPVSGSSAEARTAARRCRAPRRRCRSGGCTSGEPRCRDRRSCTPRPSCRPGSQGSHRSVSCRCTACC